MTLAGIPYLMIAICCIVILYLLLRLFIFLFQNRKSIRAEAERQTEERCNIAFITQEMRATIMDQYCSVETVGTKIPKTTKVFTVVFQTEQQETRTFHIPEEMYVGLEKGQTGLLTLVDGDFYSFAPYETEE